MQSSVVIVVVVVVVIVVAVVVVGVVGVVVVVVAASGEVFTPATLQPFNPSPVLCLALVCCDVLCFAVSYVY